MKLLVSTFDFYSFIFPSKVRSLVSKSNCSLLFSLNDCQADLIFIFCFHPKLDLPSSPATTFSFNEVCLLSVILFSNFLFNWFAVWNFNSNLVHSKSTAVANLNVHSLISIARAFPRCTIQSKKKKKKGKRMISFLFQQQPCRYPGHKLICSQVCV